MSHPINCNGVVSVDCLPSNRRRKARLKVSTAAVVWPAYEASYNVYGAGRSDLQVSLLESLSTTGLAFWSPESYECGEKVWIRFRIGTRTCQLRGVVRNNRPKTLKARHGYVCGVEFLLCKQTALAQQIVAGYLTPSPVATEA